MPGTRQTSIGGHREEITRRWNEGETCEQTAIALTLNGYPISSKTISRFRVHWGLRKRNAGTVGNTYPNRKRKDPSLVDTSTKHKDQATRRAEITARTLRGESAEQIATALEAHGFVFKNGASSVLRLQTSWQLIPYDHDRARGKGQYKKGKRLKHAAALDGVENLPKSPSTRKRTQKQPILAPSNPTETLHYPASCSNGPQRGTPAQAPNGESMDHDHSDSEPEPLTPVEHSQSGPELTDSTNHGSNVNVAAELMSAEFLVDLATSTLAAANRVKDLYIARQNSCLVAGSLSGVPSTDDDIATAKRKVREAASVMHDLAIPHANPI